MLEVNALTIWRQIVQNRHNFPASPLSSWGRGGRLLHSQAGNLTRETGLSLTEVNQEVTAMKEWNIARQTDRQLHYTLHPAPDSHWHDKPVFMERAPELKISYIKNSCTIYVIFLGILNHGRSLIYSVLKTSARSSDFAHEWHDDQWIMNWNEWGRKRSWTIPECCRRYGEKSHKTSCQDSLFRAEIRCQGLPNTKCYPFNEAIR